MIPHRFGSGEPFPVAGQAKIVVVALFDHLKGVRAPVRIVAGRTGHLCAVVFAPEEVMPLLVLVLGMGQHSAPLAGPELIIVVQGFAQGIWLVVPVVPGIAEASGGGFAHPPGVALAAGFDVAFTGESLGIDDRPGLGAAHVGGAGAVAFLASRVELRVFYLDALLVLGHDQAGVVAARAVEFEGVTGRGLFFSIPAAPLPASCGWPERSGPRAAPRRRPGGLR